MEEDSETYNSFGDPHFTEANHRDKSPSSFRPESQTPPSLNVSPEIVDQKRITPKAKQVGEK